MGVVVAAGADTVAVGGAPLRVAVIMDGNGRWAERRGLPRREGHRAGVDALERVVELCAARGVRELTLFAFSTENWRRPEDEVAGIFHLAGAFAARRGARLREGGIRFRAIGRLEALPEALRDALARLTAETAGGARMDLRLALNYGGRAELVDAARSLARDAVRDPRLLDAIDEGALRARLYDASLGDPDLVIRTGGERRLSNFLLWQLAYAEIHVTDTLWPDMDAAALDRAFADFAGRERRYGGLGAAAPAPPALAERTSSPARLPSSPITLHDRVHGSANDSAVGGSAGHRSAARTGQPAPGAGSREWAGWLRANAARPDGIAWAEARPLPAAVAAALVPSIQEFQRGESSEGRHFLARAAAHADALADPDYLEATRLFIAEENRHGALLARFLEAQAAPTLPTTIADGAFRALRRSAGLTTMIGVLLLAEIIAQVYYPALSRASDDPALRALCTRVIRDEAAHVRFQGERLGRLLALRSRAWASVAAACWGLLFVAVVGVVWVRHRRALSLGGLGLLAFAGASLRRFRRVRGAVRAEEGRERERAARLVGVAPAAAPG